MDADGGGFTDLVEAAETLCFLPRPNILIFFSSCAFSSVVYRCSRDGYRNSFQAAVTFRENQKETRKEKNPQTGTLDGRMVMSKQEQQNLSCVRRQPADIYSQGMVRGVKAFRQPRLCPGKSTGGLKATGACEYQKMETKDDPHS